MPSMQTTSPLAIRQRWGMSRRVEVQRVRARWEWARRDPIPFLRWFTWTLDQHAPEGTDPLRPFPWQRPHIQTIVRIWQHNRLLSIRKSRQMVMTWLFAALSLWDALVHKGKLIMLQSTRLEDAVGDESSGDGPLGRAKVVLNNIPYREMVLPWYDPRKHKRETRLVFKPIHSTIWAIPQGAHVIRQRTASGILSDESHFQDEFGNAYAASAPCIRGGGWFVSLSTAHPGAANDLHEDRLDVDTA